MPRGGKTVNKEPAQRGGKKGGSSQSHAKRVQASKKAAATRKQRSAS